MSFRRIMCSIKYRNTSWSTAIRCFSTEEARVSRHFRYYRPDPEEVQTRLPSNQLTVLAYRVSKDYIHYAHAELEYSTKTVRLLACESFSLTDIAAAMQPTWKRDDTPPLDDETTEGTGGKSTARRTKQKKQSTTAEENYSMVAHVVEKSPVADAYVVERIPAAAFRVKDRVMQQEFKELASRAEILLAQLAVKWNIEHRDKKDEATTESPSSDICIGPTFESTGDYAAKLFELRKSVDMCESLLPVVSKLCRGCCTSLSGIRVEIPEDIVDYLRNLDPDNSVQQHLVSAAILESVAFCSRLLEMRKSERSDVRN